MEFTKPNIVISKCLEFESCRYDGQMITNKIIESMKDFVNFIPICPEVEIGMGTPRKPIRIVKKKNKELLYQNDTKIDYLKSMENFSKKFTENLKNADGFILKSRSPSCGVRSAKYFPKENSNSAIKSGPGIFARKVLEMFPNHPIEEEKRLNNIFLREHFLTAIFTISEFNRVKTMKDVYDFQGKHKYLFMTYNQTQMRILGKIAANEEKKTFKELHRKYYKHLLLMFKKRPRYTSAINTHMHIFGYFKKDLEHTEKHFFISLLDDYKNKKTTLYSINKVLFSYAIRFNNVYLLNQSFFRPFPNELVDILIPRSPK